MGGGSGSSTLPSPAPDGRAVVQHHVLELFNMPAGAAALPDAERFKLVRCGRTGRLRACPVRGSLAYVRPHAFAVSQRAMQEVNLKPWTTPFLRGARQT